jgi:hypothetical protein
VGREQGTCLHEFSGLGSTFRPRAERYIAHEKFWGPLSRGSQLSAAQCGPPWRAAGLRSRWSWRSRLLGRGIPQLADEAEVDLRDLARLMPLSARSRAYALDGRQAAVEVGARLGAQVMDRLGRERTTRSPSTSTCSHARRLLRRQVHRGRVPRWATEPIADVGCCVAAQAATAVAVPATDIPDRVRISSVPAPAHASSEHRMPETQGPLVYFDQSVWSMWAKGQYPSAVTDRLSELAEQDRFIMVVSEWHEIETVKTGNATLTPAEAELKINHARFISQFSNLIRLRHTGDLLAQEIARAYASSFDVQLAADPPPFLPAGELDEKVRQAVAANAGYVPRSRRDRNVESGGRGSMGWWSWLDNEVNRVHQASFRAAQYERERAKRPKNWVTTIKERLTNKSLVNYLNGIVATLEPRTFVLGLTTKRTQVAEYLDHVPERLVFWRWLWTLDFGGSPALVYRVAYESLLNPRGERRPQANDGRDVEHGFAAPFVDIMVHEGGHAQFASQAAKKAGLACQIFNGRPKARELEKVVRLIEKFDTSR